MKQKDLPGIKEKQHKQVSEWQVGSFTSDTTYTVKQDGKRWTCTCPSYMKKKKACKHIQRIREKLGLSKPDASGWKSGIQKGIRRNDLPLLRLCFDRLWQDKTLRRWLLWRLPILAGEEVESYVGLTSRLQGNASRESVWELLARMSVSHKSKESEGLRVCSHLVIEQKWSPEDFVQGERLRELLSWMEIQKRIDWDGKNKEEFWSWFNVSMNEYAKETLITCKRRFYTGGMGGDRELMITIAWMCVTRPWPEPEIMDVPKEEDVEPAKGLPWYVLDMHTGVGKAIRSELRKLIEDRMEWRYVTDDLWFNSESAQVDRLFPDSFWWPTMLRMLWKKYGKTEQEAKQDWQVWRPRIKALVEKEMANQHV
jgi:hypothetical protein